MSRKTNARALIHLYDVSALQDGQFTANDMLEICDLSRLDQKKVSTVKIATLEDEGFLLDGSCSIMDDSIDSQDIVYWSKSMADFSGRFVSNPVLTRTFSENHSSAGITLNFDSDYPLPLEVKVSIYDSQGKTLNEGIFNPDSYSYFCDLLADDYQKVVIEFLKVRSYSYARLKSVEYGKMLEYSFNSDKGLSKAMLLEEVDLTSSTVSINTSSLTVIDYDETFNIDNPQGYYSLLQEKQKVQLFETIDGVEYEMANHYLNSWETTSGVVSTFKCQDILGVMDGSNYKGNLFVERTAKSIIDEIMMDFGWSDYYVDSDVGSVVLSGIIEPCSYRAALQQVVFAARGVIDTSRVSGINVYRPLHNTTTVITANRKFMSPRHKIIQNDLVTDIELTAHRYVKSADKKNVYKTVLPAGIYELTLNQPSGEFECMNCDLLDSGPFWLKVSVDKEAEVEVNAYIYEDNTIVYRKSMENLPAGSYRKTKKISNATLVSSLNASEVAEHLYDYYRYRLSHELKIICEDEKVGNFSAVKTKRNMVAVVFESMDIDLTGGFLAKAKGIGYALKVSDMQYAGEIYANDELGVI